MREKTSEPGRAAIFRPDLGLFSKDFQLRSGKTLSALARGDFFPRILFFFFFCARKETDADFDSAVPTRLQTEFEHAAR